MKDLENNIQSAVYKENNRMKCEAELFTGKIEKVQDFIIDNEIDYYSALAFYDLLNRHNLHMKLETCEGGKKPADNFTTVKIFDKDVYYLSVEFKTKFYKQDKRLVDEVLKTIKEGYLLAGYKKGIKTIHIDNIDFYGSAVVKKPVFEFRRG